MSSELLSAVAAIILACGGVSGLVAFKKLRPESGHIIVSSAEKLVLMQENVLDSQEERLKVQDGKIRELEARMEDREIAFKIELDKTRDRAQECEAREKVLSSRLDQMEQSVHKLQGDQKGRTRRKGDG